MNNITPHWLSSDIPNIDPHWLSSFILETPIRHSQRLATARQIIESSDVKSAESPFRRMVRDMMNELSQPEMVRGGFAIMSIGGPIAHAPDAWSMYFDGVEDSRQIVNQIQRLTEDQEVNGVLLDINSPGGMVTGGSDIVDATAALNRKKPVVAWSGGMMASLAYQIASQAREIISTPSASVGSIGTIIAIPDLSKAYEMMGIKMEVITNSEATLKGAGTPGTSLTDDQRDYLKARAQVAFNRFKSSVQAGRPNIKDESMRGQVFWGHEAKSNGMVDRLGDRAFALGVLKRMAKG